MKKSFVCISFLSVFVFVGCKSVKPVPIDQALTSLGKGFAGMHEAQMLKNGNQLATGLMPIQADVTFNVTALKDRDGTVKLAVSTIPIGGTAVGSVETGYAASNKSTAANTITVSFRSILFDKTTTEETTGSGTNKVTTKTVVETLADPDKIAEYYRTMDWIKQKFDVETMKAAESVRDLK